MLKAYKYRIYPTGEQRVLLEKHFGCTRLVYNLALSAKQMAYGGHRVSLSYNALAAQLTDLKNEFNWLKEVNSQSLQSALRNLDSAYQRFFKKLGGYPNFKGKSDKQSFSCPQNVNVKGGKLFLPKFKEPIELLLHRPFKGEVRTVTISKTPTGKYFASVLVDTKKSVPIKKPIVDNANTIGIDLGLKTFAVLSDGTLFEKPKHLKKSLNKIKWLQKQLSRKKKDSNRREKARRRLAKAHEKVASQRKDFLHKVSHAITTQYDTICMEDLKVRNMLKNHKLAQAISDVSWGMFRTFVEYKAEWKGKNFLLCGTFKPSSKACNECKRINKHLTIATREWICEGCGTHHDRDMNAAINIKSFALSNQNGEAVRSRQDTEVSALRPASSLRRNRAVEVSKIQNIQLQSAS